MSESWQCLSPQRRQRCQRNEPSHLRHHTTHDREPRPSPLHRDPPFRNTRSHLAAPCSSRPRRCAHPPRQRQPHQLRTRKRQSPHHRDRSRRSTLLHRQKRRHSQGHTHSTQRQVSSSQRMQRLRLSPRTQRHRAPSATDSRTDARQSHHTPQRLRARVALVRHEHQDCRHTRRSNRPHTPIRQRTQRKHRHRRRRRRRAIPQRSRCRLRLPQRPHIIYRRSAVRTRSRDRNLHPETPCPRSHGTSRDNHIQMDNQRRRSGAQIATIHRLGNT